MYITIIGAGNGGSAVSADLALKGHEVTLLKTSNATQNTHFDTILNNGFRITLIRNNQPQVAKLRLVTKNIELALKNSELIIVFVQTNFHESVIKKIAPYLCNQIVLLEPGYLGSVYLMEHVNSDQLTMVEAQSSPIDCRISNPGEVNVIFENVRNPIGIYPKEKTSETFKKLAELDYNFILTKSIIESALHNPNLIVHTIGALMSIPRIEHTDGDYWMYREVFTPSVWNIVKTLDKEKMDVLEHLGFERLAYTAACKLRNSLNDSLDAEKVFFEYAQHHSPKGPAVSNSRYITEDVPEGLVLLESMAEYLNIQVPICSSLIDMSSAALGVDFRTTGRTLERLGMDHFLKLVSSIEQ